MAISEQAFGGRAITETVELRATVPWWHRLARIARSKPLGVISAIVIVALACIALGASYVQRYDPAETFYVSNPNFNPNSTNVLTNERDEFLLDTKAPPSSSHWFGTDDGGRDTWSRIVWGTRRSLGIGVSALTVAVIVGAFLGIISGFWGGWFDTGLQRLLDAVQAFPPLLILILAATSLELSVRNLVLVLGFIGITQVSRLIRGSVLSLRELPFIEAARVLGATDSRTMTRHVLPNTLPTLIVVFTIGLPVVILAEASLTFLSLAPPAPKGSWGEMLSDGTNVIVTSAWLALFSGGAITLSVLVFNLAGDALRDVLDPRLRI